MRCGRDDVRAASQDRYGVATGLDGRFLGYRGTARDMSARVASERNAHAHAQAELLRKLSSQVPGVIFQMRLLPDASLHYLYASDACRAMYGAEPPCGGDGGDFRHGERVHARLDCASGRGRFDRRRG